MQGSWQSLASLASQSLFLVAQTCDPLYLLSFSLLRQAHQRGQELNRWHGKLSRRGLQDQLGRKGLHECVCGNIVLLVLCFRCNKKGTMRSNGLLELLLFQSYCSVMKSPVS